jgi:hypothetical protein
MTRLGVFLLGLLLSFVSPAAETTSQDVRTYDANPRHLWNRLHQTLFVRVGPDGATYGQDRLDPLFWGSTRHLLVEPSHRKALDILDEFLRKRGENLVRDPQRRAFLQHDLWALFDWAAMPYGRQHQRERAELQWRLARIIRRLALTDEELKALPDNYARAVAANATASLPHGFFSREGDWVNFTTYRGTAPSHLQNFGGRSTFHVLLRVPGGRAATLAYLERLRTFDPPWVYMEPPAAVSRAVVMNPAIPQFPAGTEWALVRRMRVIDAGGNIRATSIIESVQVRRYLVIPEDGRFASFEAQRSSQQAFEFVASRVSGDLREVQPGERDFFQFQAHDTDPFELSAEALARSSRRDDPFRNSHQQDVLRSCSTCHFAHGLHSVISVAQLAYNAPLSPPALTEFDPGPVPSDPLYSITYQNGLLRGLWMSSGRR